MHFSLLGLLVLLLVAAVCGAIGRAIAGGSTGGCLVSIVVGFVGALLGSWIAHKMHLPELFMVTIDRHPFPVLWSVIGAALFVAVVHLISGRR
ncbi:MAG: GlsB/YeaQ/YmgE family stress response membrane protein [Acidobacteriota bacterium]|nr:GlsB/YeaQ/YmgE family stress response membrane protein [Acidobacteriota bacterium]